MPIDSTKIQNPILRRIAEGDLSVVNDINEYSANITEYIYPHGELNPLAIAANNGHIEVMNRLLAKNDDGSYEFPAVIQNIAAYNNSALRHASENGHIELVNRLLSKKDDGSYEFPEVIQNIAVLDNCALREAAENGHIEVMNRLLAKNDDGSYEFPSVIKNIAAKGNYALYFASRNGHIEVLNRLLAKNDDGSYEFLEVIQNITIYNNYALCIAAENGHIEVVNRLLAKNDDGSYEFPAVIQNIAARDNYALHWASKKGHCETAYILAKSLWPNGTCDMPKEARCYLPSIQNGARIVDSRNDALQVLRCLQQGSSMLSIYSPAYSVGKNIPFDIVNNIAYLSEINGKVKLEKDGLGNVIEDNATPIEIKYSKRVMKRRAAPTP